MEEKKKIDIMLWLQIISLLCVVAIIILGVLYFRPNPDKIELSNEISIKSFDGQYPQPTATLIWPSDAAKRIVRSYSTFAINGSNIHLEAERIHALAINTNTNTEEKELEELLAFCTPTTVHTNTLGAIEIFYAVVNGNFKLYYKPVVFRAKSDPSYGQGGHFYYQYSRIADASNYYKYVPSSKSFTTETTIDVPDAIAKYKTSISIVRPPDNAPEPTPAATFYSNTEYPVYGDVTSVIIPMEQFLLLSKLSDEVCLWNAVEPLSLTQKEGGEKNIDLVKHVVILSTDNVNEEYNNRKLTYYNTSTFSDMSHLCPPSCNLNQYTFATKEAYKVPALVKPK